MFHIEPASVSDIHRRSRWRLIKCQTIWRWHFIVHNVNTSAGELNNELVKIHKCAYQWKISFNPDPTIQAQEIIFTRKISKEDQPHWFLNNNSVSKTNSQKQLGIVLDNSLSFEEHLKIILSKVNKTLGLLRKLDTFYQDLQCSPRKTSLLCLISITATLFTIKLIMQIFIRNCNWSDIMLALHQQEQ